jgi:excisionase family DNA binding protein
MSQTEIELLLRSYPTMLTVSEVAAVLRVNPRSIQRWARDGRFASVRVGKSYRIPRADVLRWLHNASIPVADPHMPSEHEG